VSADCECTAGFKSSDFFFLSFARTLRVPSLYRAGSVGTVALKPSLKETSSWTNTFVGSLGCNLRSAQDPSFISTRFGGVEGAALPRKVQAVLQNDVEDGVCSSIDKWIRLLPDNSGNSRETAVDRFVAEVLHVCDLDDGESTQLLPQEPLSFELDTLAVTSKPDHVLRCGRNPQEGGVFDVVTQDSKIAGPKQLAWGQVIGEMLAAALVNLEYEPKLAPTIFGIRVVETRWTFLRADFSVEYLTRLAEYRLLSNDRFDVWAWGGEAASVGTQQTSDVKWGLDYRSLEEREQLIRMIVAIGLEARGLAASLGSGKC